MFALTAGYHRLLAHRSYRTSRAFRFAISAIATTAVQKGPLWWAATHRHHHRVSDGPNDAHSPRLGFWWSHMGWVLSHNQLDADLSQVADLAKAKELVWLDRLYLLPPLLAFAGFWALGAWLERVAPGLGVTGAQLLVWCGAISTVLLYHGVWCVNSVVHTYGKRRFKTTDDSRNHRWVALWTFGEGWHNNHHRYPAAEQQGFYPGEIDVSHEVLKVLAKLRLVSDLKRPPESILAEGARVYPADAPEVAAAPWPDVPAREPASV
jgi:stearoyl-CoA desaturase (delta-9 desaturase)